jgi:hypothetical protein
MQLFLDCLTVMMKAVHFFEMLGTTHQVRQHNSPADSDLLKWVWYPLDHDVWFF